MAATAVGSRAEGRVARGMPPFSTLAVREPRLPVHALMLLVVLAAAVTRQGAYYTDGQRLLAVLVFVTVVFALRVRPLTMDDVRRAPVPAALCLAGWAVGSAAIAGDLIAALPTVALLAGIVAVLATCRRTDEGQRDLLAGAVVAAGSLCALSGWAGVAWRIPPLALEDQGLWRAATSLTYATPRRPSSSRWRSSPSRDSSERPRPLIPLPPPSSSSVRAPR